MLVTGNRQPPGFLAIPRTWKKKPARLSSKVTAEVHRKKYSRGPFAEEALDPGRSHRPTEDHRRPHHFLSVAAAVMLIRNLQAGENARGSCQECHAALKTPFADMRFITRQHFGKVLVQIRATGPSMSQEIFLFDDA